MSEPTPAAAKLLTETGARDLRDDYVFLRRVEHLLQIMDDQPLHILPEDVAVRARVACRLGMGSDAVALTDRLTLALERNRSFFRRLTSVP